MRDLPASLARFAKRYLIADAAPLTAQERWRSALAGLVGMLMVEALLTVLPVSADSRRLLAPAGASAVILFALPHSPLGQPWSLAGGLLLSALAGIACGQWLHPLWLAIPVAVALAIWAMARLRCLHPPGGAMAIVMASQGADWHASATVAANVAGLLLAAMLVNNLVGRRQYPLCTTPKPKPLLRRHEATPIGHSDLAQALKRMDGYLDITEADLVQVFAYAAENAYGRKQGMTCGELMTTEVPCLEFATELETVWHLFRGDATGSLPVLDRSRRVIGLVTLGGLLRHVPMGDGATEQRLRQLLRPTPGPYSNKPEVAGQVMTERFPLLRTTDNLSQVASALASSEGHDIPVVDGDGRFAGMINPTDVMAALYQQQALAAVQQGY